MLAKVMKCLAHTGQHGSWGVCPATCAAALSALGSALRHSGHAQSAFILNEKVLSGESPVSARRHREHQLLDWMGRSGVVYSAGARRGREPTQIRGTARFSTGCDGKRSLLERFQPLHSEFTSPVSPKMQTVMQTIAPARVVPATRKSGAARLSAKSAFAATPAAAFRCPPSL